MKMTKTLFLAVCLLICGNNFAQCLTIDELTPLFLRNFDGQKQYLADKGFTLNEDSYNPELFGWDWKHRSSGHYVNVKMKDCNVYTVQYRLLSDATCYKSLFDKAMSMGFKKDYQKKTSSTTYNYYKNDKFGLETAEWTSEGKNFYQFNLGNLQYFNEIEHQWDKY